VHIGSIRLKSESEAIYVRSLAAAIVTPLCCCLLPTLAYLQVLSSNRSRFCGKNALYRITKFTPKPFKLRKPSKLRSHTRHRHMHTTRARRPQPKVPSTKPRHQTPRVKAHAVPEATIVARHPHGGDVQPFTATATVVKGPSNEEEDSVPVSQVAPTRVRSRPQPVPPPPRRNDAVDDSDPSPPVVGRRYSFVRGRTASFTMYVAHAWSD